MITVYELRGRKEVPAYIISSFLIMPISLSLSLSPLALPGTTRHLLPRTAPAWASGQSREALSRVVRLEMPVSGGVCRVTRCIMWDCLRDHFSQGEAEAREV